MNTFGYIAGNPLKLIDPFGLDVNDINVIRWDLSKRFPKLYQPKYIFSDVSSFARYDRSNDLIEIPFNEKCKKMDVDDFIKMYEVMTHESRHARDKFLEYTVDNNVEFWSKYFTGKETQGPYHSDMEK